VTARRVWSAIGAVVVIAIIAVIAFVFWPAPAPKAVAAPAASPALIARGQYVATAADCVACHTRPGGQPFAGGRAFVLPFGTIYSPNITPDRATGIGGWSAGQFLRAVKEGVDDDGDELYPAFPYTSYHRMSDDDVLAVRAYLATLPAVSAPRRENALAFPFNHHSLNSSGLLHASNTSRTGASKIRVTTSSSSPLRSTFVRPSPVLSPIHLLLAFQRLHDLVEGVEAFVPDPAPAFDPGRRVLQPAAPQPAGPHAPDLLGRDQPRLFQHADVLLHARQGHAEGLGQLGDRGVRPPELFQHPAPRRVRERGEGGVESGPRKLNHLVQYLAHGPPVRKRPHFGPGGGALSYSNCGWSFAALPRPPIR
jgi:mono/diheme cytochrome c family protein